MKITFIIRSSMRNNIILIFKHIHFFFIWRTWIVVYDTDKTTHRFASLSIRVTSIKLYHKRIKNSIMSPKKKEKRYRTYQYLFREFYYLPVSAFNSSTLSVFSQGNKISVLPKCP